MRNFLVLAFFILAADHFGQIEKELNAYKTGKFYNYSSAGISKSKDVKFTINYLWDYFPTDSRENDIVKTFTKMVGNKKVYYNVGVVKLPGGRMSEKQAREEFKEYKKINLPSGSFYTNENLDLTINSAPACIIEHCGVDENTLNTKKETFEYRCTYFIYTNGHIITVNFVVAGSLDKKADLKNTYTAYDPLFQMIMKDFKF